MPYSHSSFHSNWAYPLQGNIQTWRSEGTRPKSCSFQAKPQQLLFMHLIYIGNAAPLLQEINVTPIAIKHYNYHQEIMPGECKNTHLMSAIKSHRTTKCCLFPFSIRKLLTPIYSRRYNFKQISLKSKTYCLLASMWTPFCRISTVRWNRHSLHLVADVPKLLFAVPFRCTIHKLLPTLKAQETLFSRYRAMPSNLKQPIRMDRASNYHT